LFYSSSGSQRGALLKRKAETATRPNPLNLIWIMPAEGLKAGSIRPHLHSLCWRNGE
jgi:hypothetical protein